MVQPGAGSTETPGATSTPASATAGRLTAASANVVVTAATMAMCRTARPTHRRGRGADVVVAPGVAKAGMASLLCWIGRLGEFAGTHFTWRSRTCPWLARDWLVNGRCEHLGAAGYFGHESG
jgi:hypothetical protein